MSAREGKTAMTSDQIVQHLEELSLKQSAKDIRTEIERATWFPENDIMFDVEILEASLRAAVSIAMHYSNHDVYVCQLLERLQEYAMHSTDESKKDLDLIISDILDEDQKEEGNERE